MNLEVLNRAEGYCLLCLWQEAWEVIEELPRHEKSHLEVALLRLQIARELAMWEKGERLADRIGGGARIEFKQEAARYFLERARDTRREGDSSEARRNYRKAVQAWRGIARELTERDLAELGPIEWADEDNRGEARPSQRMRSHGARFRGPGFPGRGKATLPPGSLY